MRNLHELKMNEGGRPVARKPPTDAEVASFQTHFGVLLPEDYLTFLRHSNGGHPQLYAFRPKGAVDDDLWGVDRFYHLSQDRDQVEGLWRATAAWRPALAGNVVLIGSDGGGNQILLSFDHNPPSVELCIHDENMRIVQVASSFSEFIDMLTEDPDMI